MIVIFRRVAGGVKKMSRTYLLGLCAPRSMVRTDECSAADRARRAGVVSKAEEKDDVVEEDVSSVVLQEPF